MLTKIISYFSKSRRIVQMAKESLIVREPVQETTKQSIDIKKIGWEFMNLEQLSRLSANTLQAIKNSFSKNTEHLEQDQILKQWSTIYNKLSLQSEQPEIAVQNTAQLYDLDLENEQFEQHIVKFYRQLSNPQNLLDTCQPSFIKLLNKMARQTSNSTIKLQKKDVQIGEMKPLNIQYEFWVGVHRNRSRNGQPNRYVIQNQTIDNPNNSVLVSQKDKKIQFKKIILKRRPQKYFTGLVIKVLFQVYVNGQRHHVKFQMLGPESVNNNVKRPADVALRIIDVDGIMVGNPTIQNIFKFY